MAEKTYWESLSEKDRQDSVNKDVSRALGDKIGWAYTGVLKQKWNDEVLPAILLIINNKENYEKVFRKSNTRVTRYCALYMVGEAQQDPNDKPWECAQPTIVTFHPKLRIARKLCKLLKQNECLKKLNLGFGFTFFEDQKIVLTAGNDEWYNTLFQQEILCGLPFWTPCLPQTPSSIYQRATISGVILVNNVPFLLTAAHVFYPGHSDNGDDAGNDDEDDDDDDDSTASNLYTDGSSARNTPRSVESSDITPLFRDHILDHLRDKDVYIFRKPEDSHTDDHPVSSESASSDPSAFKRFGYLSQQLIQLDIGLVICSDLDWALVTPDSWKTLKPNKVKSPAGNIVSVDSIAYNPPDGSAIVVVAGTSGVFETQASGRVNGIILPGSTHMQEIWTIDTCCRTLYSLPCCFG
ncbi:hypothetical protein EPUS_08144 [Endocarpon pusillum Z07020]|uniref:Uncharacterized protein n=1 Tax=Endocarpon pusillum (strain Z07020 / HMAS-L-300199) TaxID=1263415 RepID=U1GHF9_ENDPU|nr:uncharacterized protein EPUS_08144 [Endocarpon pusillum Z07020]ERF71226.1 hypothetical protein EPUS_08144 [Endocarpon pusillum Z07020]